MERRTSPPVHPSCRGMLNVSKKSPRIKHVQGLLYALLKRLVGGDRRLGILDLFELLLHLQIQREVSIESRMRRIIRIEPPPGRLIGTNALDDLPGLRQIAREAKNAVNLVLARESTSIKKNHTRRSFLQQKARSVEHDFHHEIVLPHRVFDLFGRKERGPNLILVKNDTVYAFRQCAGKSAFAGPRKSGHENDHGKDWSLVLVFRR